MLRDLHRDFPADIAARTNRPVAVLGGGVSGGAAARLLEARGAEAVVYDERGVGGARMDFGAEQAAAHDLAIYSPGFPQRHPWLAAARRASVLCVGELDFASLFLRPSPIVAVTGTNGKTTLTEFLVFAHKRAGHGAVAAGNIGYPLSSVMSLKGRTPLVVCEVSSFQAEDLRHFSPATLLWTNFAEDHLDRHGTLDAYFRAKYRLIERLDTTGGARLYVGESVAAAATGFGLPLPAFTKVVARAEVAGKIPAGSAFCTAAQQENYALARRYWLDTREQPESALEEAARTFTLPRHRLAKTGDAAGVAFWNDSKGTNFHAALAALDSVAATLPAGGSLHWLGGGLSKGGDLKKFAAAVAGRVRSAALIGETAGALRPLLADAGVSVEVFDKLPAAVRGAAARAVAGDAVVFSPAFASFDMFKDYADRGLAFERTVRDIVRKAR
ncbi:MAG: UDP-N-acetylmuramoyl-L-alanine--D-glutamate ligase [Puniceicoccales bacterium]|jgi:UDP-N-acetylmuramoylalanine--D-glutamate ligase|nr:UDP-N-acetylmuramoyl-L-alanine--D-glutamate ligase [Puniceicoccales bacterium]